MLVYDIVYFIYKHSGEGVHRLSFDSTYDAVFKIVEAGQYAIVKEGDDIKGVCLYYKVRNLDDVVEKIGTFYLPENFTKGHILYVHTLVIAPDSMGVLWKISRELRSRELECDTLAYRSTKRGELFYKIERRREKMRENCGIVAFDSLVRGQNKRANRISMDTLARVARDNDILLFPMKVPKDKVKDIGFPFILQTNNHFELVEDELSLEGLPLEADLYILSQKMVPEFVIEQTEAKDIKGAGDMFGNKGIIGQYFSKPARLIPLGVSALGGYMGLSPTATNLLSTAAGVGQAATTGLWGEKGAGASLLRGGASGLTTGMLGRGIGTGFQYAPSTGPIGSSGTLGERFATGFREGFGEAIPFGQTLGLYQPGAAPMNFINKYGSVLTPEQVLAINTAAGLPAGVDLGKITVSKPGWSFGQQLGQQLGAAAGGPPPGAPGGPPLDTTAATEGAPGLLGPAAEQIAERRDVQAKGLAKYLPSIAATAIAQSMRQPEYDIPSAYDAFMQMRARGVPSTFTEEGRLAAEIIRNNMTNPENIISYQADEYKNAIESDLNRREQEELAYINAKHTDNGTYGGSDWAREIAAKQAEFRDYRIQATSAIDQDIFNKRVSIYLASIAQAYQMDEQNLNALAGLTNMSVAEAAYGYGLKAQEVKDLRDALMAFATSAWPGTSDYGEKKGAA